MTAYCEGQPLSRLGRYGKFYVNTATCENPTWFEIKKVQDVSVGLSADSQEDTSRETEGWRSKIQGLKEITADTTIIHVPSDEGFQKLHRSFWLDEPVDILVLDGDIQADANYGYRTFAIVNEFGEEQPLEEVMTNAISMEGNGKPLYVMTQGGTLIDVYADAS